MRPKGSASELERRRQRAITLLDKGHAPVDVARMLGVDRRSVRRWRAAHRKRGAKGIQARPTPGRPTKLDRRQRARLERLLLRGAWSAGYESDLWTCPRIAELIAEQFGVSYHPDHIGRLLRSLGWSPQRPQRRAAERNEQRIQGWVRDDWPRIKKSVPAARLARVPRREWLDDGAVHAAHLESEE
jgi:transposase